MLNQDQDQGQETRQMGAGNITSGPTAKKYSARTLNTGSVAPGLARYLTTAPWAGTVRSPRNTCDYLYGIGTVDSYNPRGHLRTP